ncbi:DUF6789 family protein [Ktedonospora formicarum]|uniref:Uncharacterized protein n=1 Tax=Ktedonospora formicarum TaxID=2778364 RepID=A0A8J3IAQ3_9CHLR|nr:DUF6789 family protein [Ktedonospora formicarum]GHO49875.1 hypothetical protein KSX_80380 [Ktedonospora formicarum]
MTLKKRWLLLAILSLGSGIALLVHVLTPISLGLALVVTSILNVCMGLFTWRSLGTEARSELVRRVKAGVLAGLLATLLYDLSRWCIVTIFHDTFWPFDIFPLFGVAIAGHALAPDVATTIGLLYHYLNGLFFAVAYAILFAPRRWWNGILWALGLEAFMLGIYPGWLHIKALNEFVSISMVGHLTYGTVLGIVSRWSWARQMPARPANTRG